MSDQCQLDCYCIVLNNCVLVLLHVVATIYLTCTSCAYSLCRLNPVYFSFVHDYFSSGIFRLRHVYDDFTSSSTHSLLNLGTVIIWHVTYHFAVMC